MANFASSVLEDGQALFTEQYIDKSEWRPEDVAAIQVMEKGNIANPLLVNLRTASQRAVHAYLPIRQDSTGGTERVANHTGAFGDSMAKTIAWNELTETFKISAKLHNNNVESGAAMYAYALRNAINNLLHRSNATLVASLVADKTKVNVGGGNGSFNPTAFDYEVPNSQADFFFQEVQAMMKKNRYSNELISIADTKAYVLASRSAWQGAQNAQNLIPQFAGQSIVNTNEDVITGQSGSILTFAAGAVAYIPWMPLQNRKPLNPTKILDSVGDWGMIAVPELGLNFAIHAYSKQADTSAEGGSKQDVVTEFEVSIDWGYVSSPISKTDETSIFSSVLLS